MKSGQIVILACFLSRFSLKIDLKEIDLYIVHAELAT